jgi:hypothetical protein
MDVELIISSPSGLGAPSVSSEEPVFVEPSFGRLASQKSFLELETGRKAGTATPGCSFLY